jgi:hypothetical protein
MLESIEIVVGNIARYTLIEQIYLQSVVSGATAQLRENIISIYGAILVFLCKARKYFQQSSARKFFPTRAELTSMPYPVIRIRQ